VRGKHRERLAEQERGDGLYLVAWLGAEPVGHAFVDWSSGVPVGAVHVEDVGVVAGRRRRGIGRLLMERAEREALARGRPRVELVVGVGNAAARAFYGRCGYEELPGDPFVIRYPYLDDAGDEHEAHELCTAFAKQVGPTRLV
jgi:ribosomal protein S18 acetylase RimI-like enzyme